MKEVKAQNQAIDQATIAKTENTFATAIKGYVDSLRAQLEAVTKERDKYRAMFDRRVYEDDIRKVRAAYPEEISEDATELGEDFISLMAYGKLDPVRAYEVCSGARAKSQKPPVMGDVSTGTGKGEYFSKAQVERMSQKEVDKNFSKILKSMEHWK